MTRLSDEDLEVRLRDSLRAWSAAAPLGHDRLGEITGSRNRRAAAVAAVAAATVAAMLATSLLYRHQDPQVTVAGPSPQPSRIVVGKAPGVRVLAVDGADVWLMSSGDRTLYRLDVERAGVADTLPVDGYFEGVVVVDGIAWLAGYEPSRVVAIDTRNGRQVHEVPLDDPPHGIVAAFDAIWVSGGEGLTKIDPASGVDRRIELGRGTGFSSAGTDVLWVADTDANAVIAVDPRDQRVVRSIDVGGAVRAVRTGPDGLVWVTLPDDDQVVAIDQATGRVSSRVSVGDWPASLDFVSDQLWVANSRDGTVTVISLDDNTTRTLAAGSVPGGVVGTSDKAFVSLHREASVLVYDVVAPYAEMPEITASTEGGDESVAYLRCRGDGATTVVIVPDPFYDAGTFAPIERELATAVRVCRATFTQPVVAASQHAPALRREIEAIDEATSLVVVGHGLGGLAARELAATWARVTALVLMDSNTVAPDSSEAEFAEYFERVTDMRIEVPVVVITSDPSAPADPRNGRPEVRRKNKENQEALADRIGARLVVIDGDPWIPTYRSRAVADEILGTLEPGQATPAR